MKLFSVFIAFVLSFLIGQSIVLKLYMFSYRRRLFDQADDRKKHEGLVPRLGGMAFLPTQCSIFILVVVILRHFEFIYVDYQLLSQFLLLILGLGLLFITGLVDDLVGIYYKWKFAAQFVAALLIPISGLWINNLNGLFWITNIPDWMGIILTLLVIVSIINAFNLIDGLDGLCSGLTILACTVLGALFLRHESWLPVIFSFITVGALAPFFYYNVYGKTKRKRRIFMGDTGSMTLGMTVAFLVICYSTGDTNKSDPAENILIAFSVVLVPLLDVIRVIGIRLFKHKSLFLPDNNHIHHYLISLGLSRKMTLLTILLIALGYIVFNMGLVRYASCSLTIVALLDVGLWFGGLGLLSKLRNTRLAQNEQKSIKESQQDEN